MCTIALPISHEETALTIAIVVSLQKIIMKVLFTYGTVFILERKTPST